MNCINKSGKIIEIIANENALEIIELISDKVCKRRLIFLA